MKKYILGILLLVCVGLNTACTGIETYGGDDDDADAFVGTYTVSTIENVTWGGSSGTIMDEGILRIYKLSANRVKVSGYFNTYGNVIGSGIYLDSYTSTDYSGTSTIVFSAGALNSNVLTLTSTMNGVLDGYYFFATASHTCVKQ